ncbi:hypothetical protein PPACK8108_LOCUS2102 [Phakopsora pachyrhizi]|uniref:F-box domain-containing protein n=1 Tax=Phakopsora pachyrhizi TaxID=170000 RepID=A0AAV0AI92_PHAPC|nr:hypothetical protein PPACK8108_LOCUS2102 [Phakopsora pachyrhizi]
MDQTVVIATAPEIKASLTSLPVDVLNQIHLLSGSENLPIISKQFVEIFNNNLKSDHYRANYLYDKYFIPIFETMRNLCMSMSSHFGLDIQQAEAELLAEQKKFYNKRGEEKSLWKSIVSNQTYDDEDDQQQKTVYEFIKTLLDDFDASPDVHNGYPLCKSILCKDLSLVRLLLDFDASLELKDNLIMDIDIAIGDLDLIRVLIELNFEHPIERRPSKYMAFKNVKLLWDENNKYSYDFNTRKNNTIYDYNNFKGEPNVLRSKETDEEIISRLCEKIRFKDYRMDRVKVTDQMLETAMKFKQYDIAHYFLDKGATPTLETLRMIKKL